MLKGQVYTTEAGVTSDEQFLSWIRNPSQNTAEAGLSSLRGIFAVFRYMQAIESQRRAVVDGIHTALVQFDDLYQRVCEIQKRKKKERG